MKKTALLLCAAVFVLLNSACTHRLTDFTIISTKNVPIGAHSAAIKKGDTRVKAKDVAHMVLFLPLGMPNMKEAIDKAIEKHPGAIGLVDGVVKQHNWTCLLYGQNSYIVEGTPIFEESEIKEYQTPSQHKNKRQKSVKHNYEIDTDNAGQDGDNFSSLFYHEVMKGETLNGIAKSYNVKVSDLIKWNQLRSSQLKPGMRLVIMTE